MRLRGSEQQQQQQQLPLGKVELQKEWALVQSPRQTRIGSEGTGRVVMSCCN